MTNIVEEQDSKLAQIDAYIGNKIKQRRIILGITQRELGSSVGVSPQQIQKYESAVNRVASSTLYCFADQLKVDPSYFFEGIESPINPKEGHNSNNSSFAEEEGSFTYQGDVSEKEMIKLINAFQKVPNHELRKKVVDLLSELGGNKEKIALAN